MNSRAMTRAALTALLFSTLLAAERPAAGGEADPHAHHRRMMAQSPGDQTGKNARIEVKLPDLTLVDQDGQPRKFKSEVVGDHIVVMDFIYTTCTTVCPVISALFGKVQKRLGERLGERQGQEVKLVSVSIDPTRDTPARLKVYAAKFQSKDKADPTWVWLTGDKPIVDEVLKALDTYTADYADHPSVLLIGDARSDAWTRLYGFPSPERIEAKVDELLAARQTQQ